MEWVRIKHFESFDPYKKYLNTFPIDTPVVVFYGDRQLMAIYKSSQSKWFYHNAPLFKQECVTHYWPEIPNPKTIPVKIYRDNVRTSGIFGQRSHDEHFLTKLGV